MSESFFLTAAAGHHAFTDKLAADTRFANQGYLMGLGFHQQLIGIVDGIARAGYGHITSDVEQGSLSTSTGHSGYDVGLGLRASWQTGSNSSCSWIMTTWPSSTDIARLVARAAVQGAQALRPPAARRRPP